jgi:hypothetical protein
MFRPVMAIIRFLQQLRNVYIYLCEGVFMKGSLHQYALTQKYKHISKYVVLIGYTSSRSHIFRTMNSAKLELITNISERGFRHHQRLRLCEFLKKIVVKVTGI